MPRPDRINPQQMPGSGVREDIRALNASIMLITQKMKYLVRNEKILGRNLIVLNKKIKMLEDRLAGPMQSSNGGTSASNEEMMQLKQQVESLEAQLDEVRTSSASKEALKELKYVIDSINPLEFTTLSQVRDLIDRRMSEIKEAQKTASV